VGRTSLQGHGSLERTQRTGRGTVSFHPPSLKLKGRNFLPAAQ
jgi:hypothetical protein